jgi:hypothetical protein
MRSSPMIHRVALVRTDVSEERNVTLPLYSESLYKLGVLNLFYVPHSVFAGGTIEIY